MTVLFNIFFKKSLTDYFLGLYKSMKLRVSFNSLIEIYQFVFHLQKIDSCYIKTSIKDFAT